MHLNPVANVINITTMSYGVTDVSIKGSDAKGLSASLDFQVLVRNPESDPDVYPTMVEDILNISDGAEKTLSVTITNSNGAKLMEGNFTASAFNPVKVDMSGYAPGRYFVKVVSGGKTVKRTVIKL